MRRFAKEQRIWHTNLTARLPKKCFLPARSMPAIITLKEVCVCVCVSVCVCFMIIKKIYMDISFSHSNTLEARSAHVSICTRNDVVT